MGRIFDWFFENVIPALLIIMVITMVVAIGYEIYEEFRPPEIVDGRVVELEYLKEREQLTYIPLTISSGKTTSVIMQPTYIHYPETFRVKIENGDKQEEFYVNKKTYKSLNIGNRFKYEPETVKRHRPEESRDATEAEIKKMEEAK